MNPKVRDALLRLAGSDDYKVVLEYVGKQRHLLAESLVTIDPSDRDNIARFQGRVNSYDAVLDLINTAVKAAEDKGTSNG